MSVHHRISRARLEGLRGVIAGDRIPEDSDLLRVRKIAELIDNHVPADWNGQRIIAGSWEGGYGGQHLLRAIAEKLLRDQGLAVCLTRTEPPACSSIVTNSEISLDNRPPAGSEKSLFPVGIPLLSSTSIWPFTACCPGACRASPVKIPPWASDGLR